MSVTQDQGQGLGLRPEVAVPLHHALMLRVPLPREEKIIHPEVFLP